MLMARALPAVRLYVPLDRSKQRRAALFCNVWALAKVAMEKSKATVVFIV